MPFKKIFFSYLILLIFSVLIIRLFSQFNFPKKNIQLLEASTESWLSGRNDGKSGKEFYIKIKILTNQKIEFDSLWFDNTAMPTFLTNNLPSVSDKPITFSKDEIITVRVSFLNSEIISLQKAPVNYTGEGLLRYYVNSKKKYIVIPKFKQNAPQNQH